MPPVPNHILRGLVAQTLTAPANAFYPSVPAYSFTSAAGSLLFPEGNGMTNAATYTSYKGVLSQSVSNIAPMPASSTPFSVFAIVRLPFDKRYHNAAFGVVGNASTTGGNRFRIRLWGGAAGVTANRNKFEAYYFGGSGLAANPFSPACLEDAALVVLSCDGANIFSLDWYSLLTGTRNAGTPVNVTTGTNALTGGSNILNLGGHSGLGVFAANTHAGWPGEVEAIGHTLTNPSVATWQNIALGADIVSELGAANIKFLRALNGSAASLSPVAGTSDATAASQKVLGSPPGIPNSVIYSGSTLRRQSPNVWLTVNQISSGQVYGLVAGQSSRQVPFSGLAAGLNGNSVEVRVVEFETGVVVRDWTEVGVVTAGSWAGQVELPKAKTWWVAQFRCNGVMHYRHDLFAVGYKIILLGQSQTTIALGGTVAGLTNGYPMTASFATNDNQIQLARIGMNFDDAGKIAFVNTFRAFDPLTPIMLMDAAENGTGQDQFIDDNESVRLWTTFQALIDKYGNDVSVVVSNWGTNIMNRPESAVKELMTAMVYGSGPAGQEHNLTEALAVGFRFVVSPLTRHTDNTADLSSAYIGYANQCRRAQVDWAHENNLLLTPPISDLRIEDIGGPHQNASLINGSALMMHRLAVGTLKALGLVNVQNPYFTTAALANGDTQIVVNVTLPNGGSLYSPTPNDVRSFAVNEGAGWVLTGFTAQVVGNTIVLTKAAGTFAAGTRVQYLSNLAPRLNNDGVSEDAIVNSALYETWSGDVVLGRGLPVMGSLSAGKWIPTWAVVVI